MWARRLPRRQYWSISLIEVGRLPNFVPIPLDIGSLFSPCSRGHLQKLECLYASFKSLWTWPKPLTLFPRTYVETIVTIAEHNTEAAHGVWWEPGVLPVPFSLGVAFKAPLEPKSGLPIESLGAAKYLINWEGSWSGGASRWAQEVLTVEAQEILILVGAPCSMNRRSEDSKDALQVPLSSIKTAQSSLFFTKGKKATTRAPASTWSGHCNGWVVFKVFFLFLPNRLAHLLGVELLKL